MRMTDPKAVKTVVCEFDTSDDKATFDVTAALPVNERNRFMDTFQEVAKKNTAGETLKISELHTIYRDLVKVGLKKISGVYTSAGGAVTMNGHVSDEVLNQLAEVRLEGTGFDNLINWLGTEIWKANTLQEDDKKKSDSPSNS